MGLGYTTMLYDAPDVQEGIGDVAACRYDGLEIGLGKLLDAGPDVVAAALDEFGLECYCVMGGWVESDRDAARVVDDAGVAAELGAAFLGILPPRRGHVDDDTFERWLTDLCGAATEAGLRPVLHHHGATHVERPDEIRAWLDRGPASLGLLFDTAHYYPYGDVTDGIERFADDLAYVHLKDVAPPSDFADHRDALTAGEFNLDAVVSYFRAFTDLGDGVIDFTAVAAALDDAGYDGHVTIEIENRTDRPLVHAKCNYDFYREVMAGLAP